MVKRPPSGFEIHWLAAQWVKINEILEDKGSIMCYTIKIYGNIKEGFL